jgi:hypothetical protein
MVGSPLPETIPSWADLSRALRDTYIPTRASSKRSGSCAGSRGRNWPSPWPSKPWPALIERYRFDTD